MIPRMIKTRLRKIAVVKKWKPIKRQRKTLKRHMKGTSKRRSVFKAWSGSCEGTHRPTLAFLIGRKSLFRKSTTDLIVVRSIREGVFKRLWGKVPKQKLSWLMNLPSSTRSLPVSWASWGIVVRQVRRRIARTSSRPCLNKSSNSRWSLG